MTPPPLSLYATSLDCHTGLVADANYYELLGLSPTATPEEIRAAYFELAKRVHPDSGGNDALFRHVSRAYETLRDPARRAAYDRGGYVDETSAPDDTAPGWRRADRRGTGPSDDAPTGGASTGPPPSPPPASPDDSDATPAPIGLTLSGGDLRRRAAANPSWALLAGGVLLLVIATRVAGATPGLLLLGLVAVVIGFVGVLGRDRVARRAARERAEMVDVDLMSDREFDERLQAAFRRAGYAVYPVTESGVGADLVLDQPGARTVLRVRRWDNMVGPSAVEEVLNSRSRYGAQNAMVVATSSFSRDALALAASQSVETWGRSELIDFLAVQEMGPPRTGLALLGEEVRAGAPSALRGGLVVVAAVLSASLMASRSRRRRR